MDKKLFFIGLSFLAFLLGCTKLDPKIAVPAYLEIDDYTAVSDSGQGTNNHKFTDVLVFSSTQNYGYYPFPGKIPLPLTGATKLSIRPVIKVNGVNWLRVDYPLMKGSDTTLSFTAGQTTKFTPIFKYYPSANFRFLEDFNGITTQVKNPAGSADTFTVKIDFTQKCLKLRMNAAYTTFTVQSSNAMPLPTGGTNVYLEFNYKCNVAFEAGIIGTTGPNGAFSSGDFRSAGGAKASAGWNKMYISFTDLLRTPPLSPYYYLYFYSEYDSKVPSNEVYIDNVKIVSQL